MIFPISKKHLIPPIVEDRVQGLLTARSPDAKDIYAEQLEMIVLYCQDALATHNKTKFIRK